MPAPRANINARKGEVNRQMWSGRLPQEIIDFLANESHRLNISQSNVVILLVEQYKKNNETSR